MYRRGKRKLLACVFIHSEWFIKQKERGKKHIQLKKETQKLVKRKGKEEKTWKIGEYYCCCCSRARDFNSSPHQIYLKKLYVFSYENEERRGCKLLLCFLLPPLCFRFNKYHCCTVSCCCFLAIHEIYRRKFGFFLLSQTLIILSLSTNARWICMWRKFFFFFSVELSYRCEQSAFGERTFFFRWHRGKTSTTMRDDDDENIF